MTLPEEFVAKGLEMAEEGWLFGKRIRDLTHEEAIAAAAQGWREEAERRNEVRERTAKMLDLLKRMPL